MKSVETFGLTLIIIGMFPVIIGVLMIVFSPKEPPEDDPSYDIGFTIENTDGSMGFWSMTIILKKPLYIDMDKGGFVNNCTVKAEPDFVGDALILVKRSDSSSWTLPINGCTFPPLPDGVSAYKVIE